MRIASYCHNYPPHPGGLEAIVAAIGRQLVAAGHDVSLLTTGWNGRFGESSEDNVQITRLRAIHFSEDLGVPYPIPVSRIPPDTRSKLESADIHHAHGALYRTTALARRFSMTQCKPLVITEHVGFVPYANSFVSLAQQVAWTLFGDRALRYASAVVAYNRRVQGWLQNRYPGLNVHFIANGVDLDAFTPPTNTERVAARQTLGLPTDSTLALFVGRAVAKKNLGALADLDRDGYRLVCCGTERKLSNDIINLGILPHSKMPTLYQAVDFFIHVGIGEGFPVAIQEAAASGLPLLLLWDSGYQGSLRRDEAVTIDTLNDLDQALAELASNSDTRCEYGRRARKRAEESWSWERTRDLYVQVYEAAISARSAPSPQRC